MTRLAQAGDLRIFKADKKPNCVEMGSVPMISFFYFGNRSFEILDEEMLELIARDPSNAFLYDEGEDIYSLGDGQPV